MPDFLERDLKTEYGASSAIPYKIMNRRHDDEAQPCVWCISRRGSDPENAGGLRWAILSRPVSSIAVLPVLA